LGNHIIERLLLAAVRHPRVDRVAMKALLRANDLLGMALGVRLAELRDSDDRLERVFAESEASAVYAKLMEERGDILAERWDRIPEGRRPHYRPLQRYRILRLKSLLALSRQATARLFRVSEFTIARWEQRVGSDSDDEARSETVAPSPPVRRYADVVRELVRSMALLGFGGSKTIAQTLARAGWRLSERTVSRIVREKSTPPPIPAAESTQIGAVRAPFPMHTILMDLTEIPSLFGLFRFKLAVVLDAFSRMPLAAQVFPSEPTARQFARVLAHACERFGPARYLITDHGSQFTAGIFGAVVERLGIQHRFGAIGQSGSIALIERFWRTIKSQLRSRALPPLTLRVLHEELEPVLIHYAYLRPHQGLDGATPAERFFELQPAAETARSPPRARPREGPIEHPFDIAFIDREKRLPYLVRRPAA
jgi:transposase InsO family protein/DNA-binding transcriptional regulator YiaG